MPFKKPDVYINPVAADSRLANNPDLGFTPNIDLQQSDSDILIPSASGFGVVNKVLDRAATARARAINPNAAAVFVDSYEVISALPKPVMTDSDYFYQTSVINDQAFNVVDQVVVEQRFNPGDGTYTGYYQLLRTNIGRFANFGISLGPDAREDTPIRRKFVLTLDSEGADWGHTAEGEVVYGVNDNFIIVRPTSSYGSWQRAIAASGGAQTRIWFINNESALGGDPTIINNRSSIVDLYRRRGTNLKPEIGDSDTLFNLTLK